MGKANAECFALEQAIQRELKKTVGKVKVEVEKNNRAFRVDVPPQKVKGKEVRKLHLVHSDQRVLVDRVAKQIQIVEPDEKPHSRFS
ncbi:MAG: hypothetical protein V1928_03705 [Parcubacteria group bacterium]